MAKSLTGLFSSFADVLPKKVLASLGIDIISSSALTVSITSLVSQFDNNWNSIGGMALQIASLMGAPIGLGIIIGAIITRLSIQQFNKLGLVS